MTVLHTKCKKGCNCSYCGSPGMHYGLNIPRAWRAWNAWWVIKYWPHRYFRWTMPSRFFRETAKFKLQNLRREMSNESTG